MLTPSFEYAANAYSFSPRIDEDSGIHDSLWIEGLLCALERLPEQGAGLYLVARSVIATDGVVMGHGTAERGGRFVGSDFDFFPLAQDTGQIALA